MSNIINLDITDTAYGGYGVGRSSEGQVVFVPFTVEGDNVDCEIVENKKRLAFARLVKIKKLSPHRIKPECKHFSVCGGCSFGHISYNAQVDIKKRIVEKALHKYPHELPDISFHQSPQVGYRVRATVRVQEGRAGFYAFKTNKFVAVDDCVVIKPTLFAKLKEFAMRNKSFNGEVYAIETPDGLSIANITSEINCDIDIKDIFDGVTHNKRSYGLKHIGYTTKAGTVGVGRDSFFQANGYLMDDFQTLATSHVSHGLDVIELYAGAGFFTSAIAKQGNNVIGAETSQTAVNLAKYHGYNVVEQESSQFLRKAKTADIIFVDPPREGVSQKVIDNIKRLKPVSVIYVSCDPATLARDLVKLSDSYKLETLDIFDMFPDTYHVETVCRLVRA